jgi:hypothetical protein
LYIGEKEDGKGKMEDVVKKVLLYPPFEERCKKQESRREKSIEI